MPASFWSNRERLYRDALARHREAGQLEQQLGWLKTLPVRELIRAGWIGAASDPVGQLRAILGFFGVAGVEEWRALWESPEAAFRRTGAFGANPGATAAWLRKGEIEAQKVDAASFDAGVFVEALRLIRSLTTQEPAEFVPVLRAHCARAGVAVVFVPPLAGVRAYGVSRWLHSSKALIQLSLRGKTDDQLWFTFYHEAGHVAKHGKRAVFVEESGGETGVRDPREKEADAFAQEFLIPTIEYDRFSASGNFSLAAIRQFANELGIAPGLVVGRLQHEREIPFSRANHLKRRLDFGG